MESDIIKSYIKELKKGSGKAFDAIYEMYADKLYGFMLANTKSREMSEDIVQETFMKLWYNRANLSTEGSLQSFLFTISKHKMIDVFRAQMNAVEFDLYIRYIESENSDGGEQERKTFYDDFYKILKMSKKLLSKRQLEIFELSREEGRSVKEIANELQISEQTVKNQLSTSLKKIREHMCKKGILFLILLELCFIA